MSDAIRTRILLLIAEAHQKEPHRYVSDTAVSQALGLDVEAVRIQMDILEGQELTRTANSMDGRAAMLSPKGHLMVEKLREQGTGDVRPEVGFK